MINSKTTVEDFKTKGWEELMFMDNPAKKRMSSYADVKRGRIGSAFHGLQVMLNKCPTTPV